MVERAPVKGKVTGSNPVSGAKIRYYNRLKNEKSDQHIIWS